MLKIDTLNHLTDLAANTLYSAEIARLPKLSYEEEVILIERARQGDSEAREALINNCLSHALHKARVVYFERRPQHDDLLDLVQQASVQIMENLDKALKKNNPVSYLRAIANYAISQYCTYHSDLIEKPEYPLEILEKRKAYITVESLDAPVYHDGKSILVEHIEAPAMQSELDETSQRKRHTNLYKAFHQLSNRQQGILVRLYGLFGHPTETANDIGDSHLVNSNATHARKKLRALLAEYTQQMLSDIADMEE